MNRDSVFFKTSKSYYCDWCEIYEINAVPVCRGKMCVCECVHGYKYTRGVQARCGFVPWSHTVSVAQTCLRFRLLMFAQSCLFSYVFFALVYDNMLKCVCENSVPDVSESQTHYQDNNVELHNVLINNPSLEAAIFLWIFLPQQMV